MKKAVSDVLDELRNAFFNQAQDMGYGCVTIAVETNNASQIIKLDAVGEFEGAVVKLQITASTELKAALGSPLFFEYMYRGFLEAFGKWMEQHANGLKPIYGEPESKWVEVVIATKHPT